jgi:formylglycine-generating enzyme required for sulfatase activity
MLSRKGGAAGAAGPRAASTIRPSATCATPGAYVEVPAGRFPLGDEGETVEIEMPICIGPYPVTNRQYQAIMEDGGNRKQSWWSNDGWASLHRKQVTEPRLLHYPASDAPHLVNSLGRLIPSFGGSENDGGLQGDDGMEDSA